MESNLIVYSIGFFYVVGGTVLPQTGPGITTDSFNAGKIRGASDSDTQPMEQLAQQIRDKITQLEQRTALEKEERIDPDDEAKLEVQLMNLGEDDGYQAVVRRFHYGTESVEYAVYALSEAADERLLPYLIPVVFDDGKDLRAAGSDFHVPPPRYLAAGIALECISKSSAFPKITTEWTQSFKSVEPSLNREKIRQNEIAMENRLTSMRLWWIHNKTAVLSKHYDKATWLPEDYAGTKPETVPGAPSADLTAIPPLPSTPPPGEAPLSPAPLPTQIDWRVYMAVAAALLASVAVLLIRLNRRRV